MASKPTKATPIKKAAYKEHRKQPFLEKYAKYGTIWMAAQLAGISRYAVLDWRRNDLEFSQAFDSISIDVTERLEHTALERALAGNDTLLIFMLKCRNPRVYSERFRHEFEFDDRMNNLLALVTSALRRTIPEACSNCHHPLHHRQRLAEELNRVAEQYSQGPLAN